MKPLQPSEWGIRVDKSKATEIYPLRTTKTHHATTTKKDFTTLRAKREEEKKTCTKNVEKILILLLFIAFCIGFFFI